MQLKTVFLTLLVFAAPVFAELPAARLTAVFPPGAKAGASVDVAITGQDLDGATNLLFSNPGITAKKSGDGSRTEAKFTVALSGNVPPGIYDCRIIGKFGISNPRAFEVSDHDEISDLKAGSSKEAPTPLKRGVVVSARAADHGVDYWSVTAKKGERLIVICETDKIDSRLRPSLDVLGPSRSNLDRDRHAGMLDFTASSDGEYVVRVSDLLYRGGPEFFYRIRVSTDPHLDAIFPPIGKAGTKSKYTLVGRNLPGGKPATLKTADGKRLQELEVEIELPQTQEASKSLNAASLAGLDQAALTLLDSCGMVGLSSSTLNGYAYRLKSDGGWSNPVAILFGDSQVEITSEAEAPDSSRNDTPESAQHLSLPAEVAGRFFPRGDRDWYTFAAKKGDVYYIDVFADRLNQISNVSLLLQKVADGKGEKKITDVAQSPEEPPPFAPLSFRRPSLDPTVRWEVKEDGTYQLCVRDQYANASDDPTRVYRLSIRKPRPDFSVIAAPMSSAATDAAVCNPLVRQGGTIPVRIALSRMDGFAGDVTVAMEGLPKGVTCQPLVLSGGDSIGLLTIKAADDVANWSGVVRVVAKGTIGDAEVMREAQGGTIVWGTPPDKADDAGKRLDAVTSRTTQQIAIGVCGDEHDPITVTPTEDKVYEVQAGAKLSIPLKVKQNSELKQALKLKPVGVEGLKAGREVTVEPKAEAATFELDLSQTKLPPGVYTFCLASPAQVKYVRADDAPAKDSKETKDGKDPKAKKKKDEGQTSSITLYSAPITIKVLPAEKIEKKKK